MSARQSWRSFALALSRVAWIWAILHAPAVRFVLQKLPGFRTLYRSEFNRLHPFDLSHGTDTSGVVGSNELPASKCTSETTHFYWGSQPSVARSALATLPSCETFTFIDLGCGKGRPLLVASEFPFRDIIGVELSPTLVEIARANSAIIEKRYPGRTHIHVEVGDAGAYRLPPGNIVIFLYNPFGEGIMLKLVAALEAALANERRSIFVIYQNPVFGACFDTSASLKRYFAANVRYAREERGFGPDITDAVVVWQSGNLPPYNLSANARIMVARPGHRAELAV